MIYIFENYLCCCSLSLHIPYTRPDKKKIKCYTVRTDLYQATTDTLDIKPIAKNHTCLNDRLVLTCSCVICRRGTDNVKMSI